MLAKVIKHLAPAIEIDDPVVATRDFFRRAERYGVTYLQTRSYRRPIGRLTADAHWRAGGFVERIAPSEWPTSDAFRYVCFERNPLLAAIDRSLTHYRFEDFADPADPASGAYWEALSEARIAGTVCATGYGTDGAIGSAHVGFTEGAATAREALGVQLAASALVERMLRTAPALNRGGLSVREYDCLRFVAEGKTDWEISVILGISASTARFHVDRARVRLGAVNRAHAVALMLASRLM